MPDWNQYLTLRTMYYLGIALIALNNLPAIRGYLTFMDYNVLSGITVNLLISVGVLVGAWMAYRREFG